VLDRVAAHVSAVWLAVAAVGAATVAIKAVGPVLLGGRELPPRAAGVIALLAPPLFAALIVTQTFAADERLVLDERALGVGVAAVAVLLRAPLLVVVVAAAAATAVARALL
jgi:branched-subunit amino acid transport protein